MRALGAALVASRTGRAHARRWCMGPGGASVRLIPPPPTLLTAHVALVFHRASRASCLPQGSPDIYLAMDRRLRSKKFRPSTGAQPGMSLTGPRADCSASLMLFVTPVFTLAVVTGALVIIRSGALQGGDRDVRRAFRAARGGIAGGRGGVGRKFGGAHLPRRVESARSQRRDGSPWSGLSSCVLDHSRRLRSPRT